MNREYSFEIIYKLLKWGVAEFYVCAGARNFPLVETVLNIISKKKIVFNHFEERSAAFYALGRIKSLKKPVAVITTSGTAVGELFPAVMEAYYSGLPLVLITGDRPRSYRGTGAPQSAEQKNIFGIYVSACLDLEYNEEVDLLNIPKNKPLHINVCFDVPLQNGIIKPIRLSSSSASGLSVTGDITNQIESEFKKFHDFLNQSHNLLVIVSQINEVDKSNIINFLIKLNCPVYLESISNLRECKELSHLRIYCADKIWDNAEKSDFMIDSVIKIGGTPTHRFWRDLDELYKNIKVFSIGERSFSGMPNAEHMKTELNKFFKISLNIKLKDFKNNFSRKFLSYDKISFHRIHELIIKYPDAEQSLFYYLSNKINKNSKIFLGNSLPIRHWDLTATYSQKNFFIEASRGLNGIDGQISTFLGFASESCKENWGIFGDLTTLYDLAGPWMLRHRPKLNVNIVIINNSGGKIFNQVLQGKGIEFCQNTHNLKFNNFAKIWNLSYNKIKSFKELKLIHCIKQNIIEIFPNCKQTHKFSSNFLK